MRLRQEVQFFINLVLISAGWIPIATWLMPRVASAPSWDANPTWYLSSAVLGVVLAYVLRFVHTRLRYCSRMGHNRNGCAIAVDRDKTNGIAPH